MNKKTIYIITALIVICAIALISFFFIDSKNNPRNNRTSDSNNTSTTSETTTNSNENNNNENNTSTDKKILIAYYSATNTTKGVAEKIATELNADLFEIVPENVYTSDDLDWTNNNSRVSKEHDDESLRNVKLKNTKVDNWESYDTVLIGYPIWWGIAAWPVDTFVKENDFSNKTVIPFCTSASSGLGESGSLLESYANGGEWLEGKRFSSSISDDEVKQFTDSLK